MKRNVPILTFCVCFLTLVFVPTAAQSNPTTERVSISSTGTEGDNNSYTSALSANGRFVAFQSYASNLVLNDSNNFGDVFVRDRQTGTTERVSISSADLQSNNASYSAALSADGRFVAFTSDASNLVPGDNNNVSDVFVHDRQTGTTERVSISSADLQSNSSSSFPVLSADGHFVAFQSYASNLVSGDNNGQGDIFVRDRQTGTTERISLSSADLESNNGSNYPALSADGRFVAFQSDASNLVSGDSNGQSDVFVRDRQTGTTERVSLSSTGVQGNSYSYSFDLALSGDGRFVAFQSDASNLVSGDSNNTGDIFVRDRQTGTTERVSVNSAGLQSNGFSAAPTISSDGFSVAFISYASNLVSGDTNGQGDSFIHDRQNGITERVSLSSTGVQGNSNSGGNLPALSANGLLVAFTSDASNLVPGDSNGFSDIFVRNRPPTGAPKRNYYTTDTPTLTWSRVSWANTYEIQVDDTLNFSSTLDFTASVPADQLSTPTSSLVNGTYYWHVRACPATGTCSAWSATDSFVVGS